MSAVVVKWDPRITEQKKPTYKLLGLTFGPCGIALLAFTLIPHPPGAGSRAVLYVGGAVFLALALVAAYALDVLRRRRRDAR